MKDKFILDACCGGRMIWFDKQHPATIYTDIRKEEKGFHEPRKNFEVNPDIIMDFRDLKFSDKSFKLIVFDPPHIYRQNNKSWISDKYGMLNPTTWQDDLKKGFNECWRVLEDHGVLIFKWSEAQIKTKEILNIFNRQPLFGHTTAKAGPTKWMCFMKIPTQESPQTNSQQSKVVRGGASKRSQRASITADTKVKGGKMENKKEEFCKICAERLDSTGKCVECIKRSL